jgi:sodium/proline symporter
MNIQLIGAFALYFLTLFAIAFTFYRRSKTAKGFALGNRSLNYWATAISAQASDMGSWLFLGYPSAVYVLGLSQIWIAVGLILCMWLNWRYIAPRLRTLTERYASLTLWTFFEKRFQDNSNRIRTMSTLFAFIFFIAYIATGLIGIGRLFEAEFGISCNNGVLIGALLTSTYILLGGFLAAAWCNLFQGLFLISMLALVPLHAYQYLGGYSGLQSTIPTEMLTLVGNSHNALYYFLLALGWGLGYFGQPHVLINFMGIEHTRDMKKAQYIGLTWQILALSASIATGIMAIAFFKGTNVNPEHIFPLMVKDLFGPFMTGLVLCGVLAAILSTVTMQIIVASTALVQDIVKIDIPLTTRQTAYATRVAIIFITILSVIIARHTTVGIHSLVQFAWSGLGSTFGPLVILSLYSKKINRYGALAAITTGGLTAMTAPLFTALPALVIGFATSLFSAYTVSYITRSAAQ